MRAFALVALASVSCAETVRAPPRPAAVAPTQGEDDAAVALAISGDFAPRVTTDFATGAGSAIDAAFEVTLVPSSGAPVTLASAKLTSAGTIAATVPQGLARGLYGVSVTDASGRSGLLPDVYRVVRAASHVVRFELASVGVQRVGVPFAVRVTAVDSAGARVDGFTGSVGLSDATGTATPARLGPFSLGRVRTQVQIAVASSADVLEVIDDSGRTGSSAPFPVGAGQAASAVLLGVPTSLDAGACSPAITVEVRDGAGLPAPGVSMAAAPSAAPPDGVSFFADAACATPLTSLTLGGAAAAFHVRATVAGTLSLRVVPNELPSTRAPFAVTPLAPVRVAFATPSPSLAVGACSSAVELAAHDSYGNDSAPTADVAVTLTSRPAGALAFFGDAACSTPAPPSLVAGQHRARFFVRATAAGNARIDAATDGLAGDAQDLTVGL